MRSVLMQWKKSQAESAVLTAELLITVQNLQRNFKVHKSLHAALERRHAEENLSLSNTEDQMQDLTIPDSPFSVDCTEIAWLRPKTEHLCAIHASRHNVSA